MSLTPPVAVEIEDFVRPAKPNIYDQHVAALIAAGENKSVKITVPKDEAAKHRRYFAKAANNADRTAETVETVEGDDTTTFRFMLTARVQRKTEPGENTGENTGENSGENTGENTGENSGENTGENTGENSGETAPEVETAPEDGDVAGESETAPEPAPEDGDAPKRGRK